MNVPAKRQQRPCDNCRRRRIRCLFASEAEQECVLCVSRSTKCTYVESAPTKKRAAPGSEGRNGDHEQRSRPRARPPPGSVSHVKPELPANSLLKETLGHHNRQSSEIVGASGDYDYSLATGLPWNAKGEFAAFKAPQLLRRADETTFFIITADSSDETAQDFADLDEIENFIAPHGPELVSLYFRIVHPSFPILHKRVFLEKHGRTYRELTPTGLGAVYVLALNWWSYSSKLSDLPKPDAKKLECKVLRMLFDTHRRPKISDLQGGLVLMQSPNAASWAITGHLVAMAQNLGINADCTHWQVPDWERGVRKRVAWALFMQDKWGALIFGRASHIRPDDWEVQPLSDADFPETAIDDDDEEGSAAIEQGKQTFMQMVSLANIVSRLLDQFFTLRAIQRRQSLETVLEYAKPLQLELKNWYANMPWTLSIEETAARKLSSVGYLHLAYYTAEVSLHRAILRSCAYSEDRPGLMVIARNAAATRFIAAHDFVKRLKGEHLQSFWYYTSSSSLAIIGLLAAILCATAPSPAAEHTSQQPTDERSKYLSHLAEYRWTLRVSARSADFIGAAVTLLDSRTLALEQRSTQPQSTQDSSTNAGEQSPAEVLYADPSLESSYAPQQGAWATQAFYDFSTPHPSFAWEDLASPYPPLE